ncbi:FAD-dependent monooxygenase [Nocardia brasiliensis]|uniref:FAD-dependent monooxygenase n=1 Tax=Nocardia brasiliensis TaxID=37326 RepID=UPI0019330C01|nr:FAD-dependent monooxygenase [Nocardia brasiliensis]
MLSSQDRLEPTLLAAASTPVRFEVEAVALAEGADGVVALLIDRGSRARTRVRADYVLGADGANSAVRQALCIGTTGPRPAPPCDLGRLRRRPAAITRAHG